MDALEDFSEKVGIRAIGMEKLAAALSADSAKGNGISVIETSAESWKVPSLLPFCTFGILFLAPASIARRLADEVQLRDDGGAIVPFWMCDGFRMATGMLRKNMLTHKTTSTSLDIFDANMVFPYFLVTRRG